MITFFRSFFQSRLGIAITLGFVGLIALAFASSDITGTGFGGVAGGDRAAVVGDQRIGTGALSQAVSNAFERAREQNPTLTMQRFVGSGAVDAVLEDMIDRNAIFEFGRLNGLAASDRLVDSEILKIPGFRGPDGQFSDQVYRQTLAQQGLTDQIVRDDLGQGLVAKQVLVPVSFGAVAPRSLAVRYASLSQERRSGVIALLPSSAFAPTAAPADSALATFYAANRAAYTVPERRVIRYASFGGEALKGELTPTGNEIAAAYTANRAKYAASETRAITQVILPTQAAAQALAAEVRGGASLETAARTKGLLPSALAATREALAGQASPAVAQAVFAAARGSIAAPARGGLGWHVVRIDTITARPARTLAEAREELVEGLVAAKRREALADLTARIEEEFDSGGNLGDFASELGLTLTSTAPLTADGGVFGKPGETAPAELLPILPTAFLMESENQPQLAELVAGTRFLVFDVAEITPAAPPPLAQVRARVAADWAQAQGAARARAAADKVIAALARRVPLAQALAAADAGSARIETVDTGRQELIGGGQRVAPPLALMFSMAEGTAKRLEAAGREGWYVVSLNDIVPGVIDPADPRVTGLQRELGGLTGREYADQFRRALRKEIGVERNATAIRAVGTNLTGGN